MSDTNKMVVYLSKISYPSKKAHAIQITRTITALAKEVPVLFVVNKITCRKDKLKETIQDYFGCDATENLHIIQINSIFLNKYYLFPLLFRIIKNNAKQNDFVFYTRSYSLALNLIKLKRVHNKKIFFESHKKDGIHKDDLVANTKYHAIRDVINDRNDDINTIKEVYENVDTVFFLHRHSEVRAKEMFKIKDSDFLWYGAKENAFPAVEERKLDFVYCGGIGEKKIFDLLIEVAKILGPPFKIDVYGGTEEEIRVRKEQIEELGCASSFSFMGYIPNKELAGRLQRYRFGFAMVEGIKVVDYIENGVIPIIAAIPSFLEIFDEKTALFFQPDSASDLAKAITSLPDRNFDKTMLKDIIAQYSMQNRARKIINHL